MGAAALRRPRSSRSVCAPPGSLAGRSLDAGQGAGAATRRRPARLRWAPARRIQPDAGLARAADQAGRSRPPGLERATCATERPEPPGQPRGDRGGAPTDRPTRPRPSPARSTLAVTDVAIRLSGVTKTYGVGAQASRALEGLDFEVRSGTFVSLMGPSGSGKTTLLNLIAGLD